MASQSSSVSAIGFCSSTLNTRFSRGDHVLGVSVRGAGDENCINVAARQQLVKLRVPIQAELGRLRLTALAVVIPAGDHFRVVKIRDCAAVDADMAVREADDAQTDPLAHSG